MEKRFFGAALGLSPPWQISRVSFSSGKMEIAIHVATGAPLACPGCGTAATFHDADRQSWHHDDLFDRQVTLAVELPLVSCERCGVAALPLPWQGKRIAARLREQPGKEEGEG